MMGSSLGLALVAWLACRGSRVQLVAAAGNPGLGAAINRDSQHSHDGENDDDDRGYRQYHRHQKAFPRKGSILPQ